MSGKISSFFRMTYHLVYLLIDFYQSHLCSAPMMKFSVFKSKSQGNTCIETVVTHFPVYHTAESVYLELVLLPAYCCCYNRRSRRRSCLPRLWPHKGRRSAASVLLPRWRRAAIMRVICRYSSCILALPMWLISSLPPMDTNSNADCSTQVLLRTYSAPTPAL